MSRPCLAVLGLAPGFQDDYADKNAGKTNDNLINSNCAKTFNS